MKFCPQCKCAKKKDEFNVRVKGKPTLASWCKVCTREDNRLRSKLYRTNMLGENIFRGLYQWSCHLWSKYRIRLDDWQEIYEAQAGVCALRGCTFRSTRVMHYDHDHVTGRFRGILCAGCNTNLGVYESYVTDSRVANYLKRS